jgi:hypothetical protein
MTSVIDAIIDLINSWAASARYSITSGAAAAKQKRRPNDPEWLGITPDTPAYSTSGLDARPP